ncbi:Uncharacterised protein [Acinetobacter baumannii]|nr:Uncharacterised protein [Acinetobacter baumannii]SSS47872.1 Uncharacterised protein [Acinetobacter baumannii]
MLYHPTRTDHHCHDVSHQIIWQNTSQNLLRKRPYQLRQLKQFLSLRDILEPTFLKQLFESHVSEHQAPETLVGIRGPWFQLA